MKTRKRKLDQLCLMCVMTFLLCHAESHAAEVLLKGRLMSPLSTGVDVAVHTPADGIGFKIGNPTGYVFFEDGQIAQKQWVFAQTNVNGHESGLVTGYGIYVFENGDSLTLAHESSWNSTGMKGQYTRVIHGTGRYAGATGTGSISGLDSPWPQTELFDITLVITTRD